MPNIKTLDSLMLVPQGVVGTMMPWLIDVDVFGQAVSHVNWDTITIDLSSNLFAGYKRSSGVQNDEINFDVVLAGGVWDVEVMTLLGISQGICSLSFDDIVIGTMDWYSATTSYNFRNSIVGVVVPTTKNVRLKLKMTGKNTSATSYIGNIQHIQLRRTA